MKTELPCGIVQDLLPGYIDDLTSEATNTAVEEHLAHCEACAKMYDEMNAEIAHTTVNVDDKKLLKQSQKKLSKRIWKVAVIVALTVAITLSGTYMAHFWYWGRRHSVLYDVKTVTVVKNEEQEGVYDLTYDVSVRNWDHDIIPHTYKLEDCLSGEPGMWYFEGESDYFTTGIKPVEFQIKVTFDVASVVPYAGMPETDEALVEYAIGISQFAACGYWGQAVESANLYMADNRGAEIIFE